LIICYHSTDNWNVSHSWEVTECYRFVVCHVVLCTAGQFYWLQAYNSGEKRSATSEGPREDNVGHNILVADMWWTDGNLFTYIAQVSCIPYACPKNTNGTALLSGNAVDSDSAGGRFESRPRHRLSYLRVFIIFLSPSRWMSE
jgi:hypothetical protein